MKFFLLSCTTSHLRAFSGLPTAWRLVLMESTWYKTKLKNQEYLNHHQVGMALIWVYINRYLLIASKTHGSADYCTVTPTFF